MEYHIFYNGDEYGSCEYRSIDRVIEDIEFEVGGPVEADEPECGCVYVTGPEMEK